MPAGHRVPGADTLTRPAGASSTAPPERQGRRLPWRTLLPLSWVSAVAWAVLLAFLDGHQTLTGPIARRGEYVPAVEEVGGNPAAWLANW